MKPRVGDIWKVYYLKRWQVAYKSDLIHSATGYFGWDHPLPSKRMAAGFFWKAQKQLFFNLSLNALS